MGTLKTLALVLFFLPAQATALPLDKLFADCAGRFSAELEHAWLFGDPEIEVLAGRRDRFAGLLDAVSAKPDGARLMALRIEAKVAHAELLNEATFGGDRTRARAARARARAEIRLCEGLLLDG